MPNRSSRGFSLLEILIVVALVGVLIALAAPLLNDIRTRGRFTSTITNARSHATILTLYATDHKDTWPYFADPRAASSVIVYDHGQSSVEISYFRSGSFWRVALVDQYYDALWAHPSFRSALKSASTQRSIDYFYPCVFIGRPEYYNPATRTRPPDQLGPTRLSDVTFPADKALITDFAAEELPPIRGTSWRVFATVDTSAGRWRLEQLNGGMQSGDGQQTFNEQLGGHWPGDLFDLRHTLDGFRGRDF